MLQQKSQDVKSAFVGKTPSPIDAELMFVFFVISVAT
jgi:hypothetical protein